MNQQSTLVGLFKEVYGDNIVEAWGFMAKLLSRVKFVRQDLQPGNFYHQPVDVVFEQGITAAAAGTTAGVGSAPFLPASAGQMQDAQLAGAQLIGRSLVSYEAIARSANDKGAFKSATQHVVRRLSQSVIKRAEIQMLHGTRGIGAISANPSSGASRTIVITDESWSAGIWAGSVGASLDLYNTSGVKQNTGKTSTGDAITVSSVNAAAKSVVLSVPNATDQSLNLANLNVFWESASPTSEMYGLDAITRVSPSSSTFWNINPATYDLWNANQYSTSTGVLSFPKLLEACGLLASYALMDDVVAVMSPRAFEVLNSDIAALRQYDVSYTDSRAKNGTKALTFAAQTGNVEIVAHAFQKDGLVHLFTPSEALRVGASDVSFITRQGSEDKLILESSTSAGSEMRAYSNQSLFVSQLRHTALMAGVTY